MAEFLCPHCGMPNDPKQNVCSFCRQPLRVPDEINPIRPGETPTKKTTAELEPVLPAWLREAREMARRAEAEKNAAATEQEAEKPAPKPEPPDLLAGLESLAREEPDEEIPEWLRGAAPVSTTPLKSDKKEQTFPRRQELRWGEEAEEALGGLAAAPAPSAPESGDALLPWLSDVGKESTEEKEVSDWLNRQAAAQEQAAPVSPFMDGTFKPPATGELTDWLDKARAEMEPAAAKPVSESGDSFGEWLSNLPREESFNESALPEETLQEAIELPDWMQAGELPPAPKQQEASPSASRGDASSPSTPAFQKADEVSLPDWLTSIEQMTAAPLADADETLPDWLKSVEPRPAEQAEPASMPDWLSAFEEKEQLSPRAETKEEKPSPPVPRAPAFVSTTEALDNAQTEDLFSMELPDWLSRISPANQPSAEEPLETIVPAELPSWVQAMRPVETVLPDAQSTRPIIEGPLEAEGPLAGLRGVLPLHGELIRPGKPKAHAIRLQVSEAQQADASLLEQMLAAERQAKPLRGGERLLSQRVLRWILSALLILLAAFFLATHSQSVPLPMVLPPESALALPVLDALPENAPVLMIFDYEPALAGELEAAAAPFVDRLLGLRYPRVTILSTSPTGAALAERFFARMQTQHNYQANVHYINLGYLPGGTTGILSFAVNPRAAIPSAAWTLMPAQDVTQFSDYAVILLLTDQAETARGWVEQTISYRKGRPMLVISSAQAAPMIQPYLLSAQVNGLVVGVHGGAAFESANQTKGLARRYWDAYNYLTLLAALTILVGGLWNWIAGARSRQQGLDEI